MTSMQCQATTTSSSTTTRISGRVGYGCFRSASCRTFYFCVLSLRACLFFLFYIYIFSRARLLGLLPCFATFADTPLRPLLGFSTYIYSTSYFVCMYSTCIGCCNYRAREPAFHTMLPCGASVPNIARCVTAGADAGACPARY